MNCVVCGAGSRRAKLRVGEVEILECAACGAASWEPEPDFRPETVYDADYFAGAGAARGYDDYGAQEASLRATFRRRIARIPRPGPGARLLDVGAAFGFAVAEAARAGWQAFGVERAPAAARRAGAGGGPVLVGSALSLPFAPAAFQAVTLWDVLEHLPDPHAAIAEAARVLAPGGRLVLTTGDVGSLAARFSGPRWHLYTLPEHLFFYTRKSLRLLLEAHGLRVERLSAEGSLYTLGYLAERLRKTVLRRGKDRPGRFPGAGLCVPVNFFDIVTARAVRVAG